MGYFQAIQKSMFIASILKQGFANIEELSLNPDIKSIDFEKILKIARNNNISQKLYSILRDEQWNNHGYFMAELRRDYLSTAARNTLIYSEFKKAAEGFKDKEIDVIVMNEEDETGS